MIKQEEKLKEIKAKQLEKEQQEKRNTHILQMEKLHRGQVEELNSLDSLPDSKPLTIKSVS